MGIQITAKEAFENLANALETFSDSDTYRQFLKSVSKLYRYSPLNTLLIRSQCPTASKVAGFKAWTKLNRQVIKGESAITILVPIKFNKEKADGKLEQHLFFKAQNCLFDITQTELIDPELGDPVNEPPMWAAGGETLLYNEIRDTVIREGVTVTEVDTLGVNSSALGCYYPFLNAISIVHGSTGQMTNVLLHEWAHSRVHGDGKTYSYGEEEVIVESITYIVAQALGIQDETNTSSFVYITNWLQNDKDKFKKAVSVIQKEAKAMIELLEDDDDNNDSTTVENNSPININVA